MGNGAHTEVWGQLAVHRRQAESESKLGGVSDGGCRCVGNG